MPRSGRSWAAPSVITMKTSQINKITYVTMAALTSKIIHARGTAYGVRMDSLTSYEAQIEHYTAYIGGHPDWVLAGIFADVDRSYGQFPK